MDFEAKIEKYKETVDIILKNYFDSKINEYNDISSFVKKFVEDLSEFTLRGGKRFRAAVFKRYNLLI